jgi:hypothetical protein
MVRNNIISERIIPPMPILINTFRDKIKVKFL